MYILTKTYTDFNGNEKTEDFYFNFTQADLAEMELSMEGGLSAYLEKIVKASDQSEIIRYFKYIVLESYGKRTPDGKFYKNDEIKAEFKATQAYSDIFMELAQDADAAATFINKIMPANASEKPHLVASSVTSNV